MARRTARRTLIWHIGLPLAPRSVIPANLLVHGDALGAHDVLVAASPEEGRLATHELLRTHRDAGLARAEVEGTWARICDRVWDHRGVSVLSTPDLGAADKDQVRLALDPLRGVEVHLVVTLDSFSQQLYGAWLAELRSGRATSWDTYAGRILDAEQEGATRHRQAEEFWAGHDLDALLTRWGWTLHDDRVHVVADTDVTRHWQVYADLAGVDADLLPAVLPAYADPAGVAVLRKVNRQVESPLGRGSSDLLTVAERAQQERAAMPVAPTEVLEPMVERWSRTLAASAYDVHGDLAALLDRGPRTSLPGPRDQLGAAVDALAEALGENTRLSARVQDLESDRARLDRKRRKLKRRLKALSE